MTTKIIASALRSNGYYLDVANNTLYTTAPFEKKSNIYGTQEYKLVCEIMAQYPDVKISIQKKNRKHTLSYDMMKERYERTGEKPDMYDVYEQMVKEGRLGRKTGHGFYDYE